MTAVIKYDEACRAVAAARTIDDVREWEDKAAAVREYSRRARNRSMEIDALEIRARARRRRGELLLELKEQGRLVKGSDKVTAQVPNRITLEELGVSKNESSRDQKLAAVDGNSFERLVERCRAYMEENPDKHSFDVLKDGQGPINGARSIMGSRQEPDDSLDYFPTPPWATRALMEVVWPVTVPSGRKITAWEPACGEGHIAEVLREYFPNVFATDIHDYGYQDEVADFLNPDVIGSQPDWIITNPPFNEKAEAFVFKALDRAQVGVAMFLRLQWLETNGRYERIFKPYPPSLIAQFAERVPLCKGRWNPDGDTATAYLWIVWMPERQSARGLTEFFWIPPGQREALTRPDDAARFTAHPVIKAKRDSAGNVISPDSDGVVQDEAAE